MMPCASEIKFAASDVEICFPLCALTSLMNAFSWFTAPFMLSPFNDWLAALSLASRLDVTPWGRLKLFTVEASDCMACCGDSTVKVDVPELVACDESPEYEAVIVTVPGDAGGV
jgi:hypothetical protein